MPAMRTFVKTENGKYVDAEGVPEKSSGTGLHAFAGGTLENARESLLRYGAARGTVSCYTCGHSIHLHYENDAGHQGCVADQPSISLEALIRGRQPSHLSAADGSCLCAGWVRGQLPHATTKHLDGLTDPDDDRPCPACNHPMHEHSNPEGCWQCPCAVAAI